MNTTRLRHIAARVRRGWNEMDYAQRRLFEVQTGIPVTGETHRSIKRDPTTRLYRRDY